MSSERIKSLRTRNLVQNSENHIHGSEPLKTHLNKNHIQKNNIALRNLTNTNSLYTLKNTGTALGKAKYSGLEGKKEIKMPQVGRQTRNKGKAVSLNSTENETKLKVKKTYKSAQNPEIVKEMINVGEDLSNAGSRTTRKTAKESADSCKSSPLNSKTHHPKESQDSIQEELAVSEKKDNLLNPKNSSEVPPSSSKIEILEASRLTRQTRSMGNLQKTVTSNKPQPNLMSPKPTAKNAQSKDSPVRQTRSHVAVSPILRSTRKSSTTPTAVKLMKPKRKTALERWLEEAGDVILPDGSSETCRKSSRLLSAQSNHSSNSSKVSEKLQSPKGGVKSAKLMSPKSGRKSPAKLMSPKSGVKSPAKLMSPKSGVKSPAKLMSPKSGVKSAKLMSPKSGRKSPAKLMSPKSGMRLKSPGLVSKILPSKKVPVWKTDPKPEFIHSAPNDVYGFEYDPSDCKPAKKKRTRKPKNDDDVFKARKVKAAPKPTKRLQRVAVAVTEKPQTPIKSKPKPTPMKTTPLLKSVVKKLNNLTQPAIEENPEVEDVVAILNFSPIANHSSTVYDTTLPEEMDFEHNKPCLESLDEMEKSAESGVLAGDLDIEEEQTKMAYSQVEVGMQKLFGFETEPENLPSVSTKPIEKQLVKSTPIKERTVAECFSSVSPVRKYSKASRKSINRPARIDENVARHLIRGIRPLQPVKDKQKATTLLQYIQELGENPEEENLGQKKTAVVQTPSPVFTEPARKSYSKRDLRNAKRKIMLSSDDFEVGQLASSDDDDDIARKKPKKRAEKTVHKKNKRDEEEEKWCEMMNSHFEDIEKFNLSS